MSKLARFFIIFFWIFLLVGGTLIASFIWDAFLKSPDQGAETVVISVGTGESLKNISVALKRNDLIASRYGFQFYTRLVHADRNLQPGEFTIKKGLSYASIVSILTTISPDEVTITFPEGLTSKQMSEKIETAFGSGFGDQWLEDLSTEKWSEVYSFLPTEKNPEGYLFPDTYRVSRSGFPDSLTYKLLTNFGEKLSPELRVEIAKQGKTIHEIITLASIVEKEVASDEDRAKVADIFWRRLAAGMALQADSTVHYVVGNDSGSVYTSDDDRSVDSPYNTYKYPGLPPGPICNPGLSAIKAVIFPITNSAWYFLTDAEGGVYYARTNEEQNENKVLYLR